MKLKDVINESAYCSIGCITKLDDIENLERYVLYNLPVISQFPKIIIAHTKTDNVTQRELNDYNNIWLKHFGDKCIMINRKNYGHTFGFTDLDKTVIFQSKHMGYKWIWKSTNDILINETIFNVEMDDSEFFFFQGHGYTGMESYYKLDVDKAVDSFKDNGYEYFFPQTNFFITKSDIDCLCEDEWFENLYNKCINDPNYINNKTQIEYKYLLCEIVLRDCVWRNNLKCKHLIGKESYKKLIQTIIFNRISDSSHKNIFFTECGICHFHFMEQPVLEI